MMSCVDTRTPVGNLVAERLGRARVFDRFGIDYCCGGRKPLERACRDRGLDPATVCAAIEESDAAGSGDERDDWAVAPLDQLIGHVVTQHHGYLRRELPRLAAHAEKVANVHSGRHPELVELREVFDGLARELIGHTQKEEMVLFPYLARLGSSEDLPPAPFGRAAYPIAVMEQEHESAGEALARLRALTGDYTPPVDACMTYRALLAGLADLEDDLHRHIHKENHILFPRALAAEERLRAGAAGGPTS